MENQVLESLKGRRSVRKYSSRMVEQDKLNAIMEAATYAPTGMGTQSPRIVLVKNKEIRDFISRLNARVIGNENMDPFYGAPVVAIVFARKGDSTVYLEDAALVAGNLLNAAHAVGVDSCYIHRAREVFESEEGLALKKDWGIEEYVGVANCILGYGEGEYPKAKDRKPDYVMEIV